MCQAPQTINRFIVSPSPRSFFIIIYFCVISGRSSPWMNGGGWWWLVSTSPGVWNALNLIHSRAPDIQHRTADSPDVIGSQGNLQLSQDLGGFLNSPSEFLQQKKRKERRRGALIFLETRSEIASHHMAAFTGTNFFLRGRKKRKSRTRHSRKPQTHRYERKFELARSNESVRYQ